EPQDQVTNGKPNREVRQRELSGRHAPRHGQEEIEEEHAHGEPPSTARMYCSRSSNCSAAVDAKVKTASAPRPIKTVSAANMAMGSSNIFFALPNDAWPAPGAPSPGQGFQKA